MSVPTSDALVTFKDATAKDALILMRDMFGEERAREAAQHVAVAFRTLARLNPKVAECTRASVAQCLAMCALTRLMPGGAMPGVYLIPRGRKVKPTDPNHRGEWPTVQELNFQVGFRGLIQLAQRAGYTLAAYPVYVGAPVHLDPLGRLVIPDAPQRPDRSWDNLIGVTVTIHTTRGEYLGCHFVGVDLIEARRNVSDSWVKGNDPETYDFKTRKRRPKTDDEAERDRQSPWFQWPEEMALKTALTYVVRRGYVPLDDVAGEVLSADARADVIDATATVVQTIPAPAPPAATSSARDSLRSKPRLITEAAPTEPLPDASEPSDEERAAILARESAEAGDATPPDDDGAP